MENVLQAINCEMEVLKGRAVALIVEYVRSHIQDNRDKPLSKRSVLGVRLKEANDTFYAEWFWSEWVTGRNGERRWLPHYIRRGRNYRHSNNSLLRYARPWEADRVIEFETKFAVLRRQAHYLVAARRNIRTGMRVITGSNVEG